MELIRGLFRQIRRIELPKANAQRKSGPQLRIQRGAAITSGLPLEIKNSNLIGWTKQYMNKPESKGPKTNKSGSRPLNKASLPQILPELIRLG